MSKPVIWIGAFIFIFSFLGQYPLYAQNGIIYLKNNQKIAGKIFHTNNRFATYLRIIPDSATSKKKQKVKLNDTAGFRIEEDTFAILYDFTHEEPSLGLTKRSFGICKVLVTGPVCLYEIKILNRINSYTRSYVLARQTDNYENGYGVVTSDWYAFSEDLEEYFSDYPDLAEAIAQDELNEDDMEEIVRTYNVWKQQKED